MKTLERIELEKINDYMCLKGLDACIFMDPVLGHHMTGWMPFERRDWAPEERALIFVFLKQGEPFIVFRNSVFSGPPLQAIKNIYPCHLILEEKTKVLINQLKKRGIKSGKTGIEMDVMPARTYGQLKKSFPNMAFRDISAFSKGLCVKKDPGQVAFVRKALFATEKGFESIFREVSQTFPQKQQISKLKLEQIFRKTILKYDAQVYDEEMSMHDKILKKGDYTLFDMVVRYNGYLSDLCLGIYLGNKLSAEIQEKQNMAHKIIDTVSSILKPGMTIGEAERASDNALKKAFGTRYEKDDISKKWVVHGIGLSIHAEPRFGRDYRGPSREDARKTIILEPGAILICEICGFGEEIFLMNENGLEKMGNLRTGVYTLRQMGNTAPNKKSTFKR